MDKPQEKTETQTTETQTETPAAQAPADDDKAGLRAALAKQAAEKDARYAALEKKLNAREAAEAKARELKLAEEGKHKELLEEEKKNSVAKDKIIADLKRSQLSDKAWKVLNGLGMSDPDRLELYSTSKLPSDATPESIDEWAKLLKADSPDKFEALKTPVGQASLPGGPAVNGSDTASLEARLKSDDPKIRAAAFSEQLGKELSGQ